MVQDRLTTVFLKERCSTLFVYGGILLVTLFLFFTFPFPAQAATDHSADFTDHSGDTIDHSGDTTTLGFWHDHISLTEHWHNGSTDHSGDTIDHSGDTIDHSGDTTTLGFWHDHISLTEHWHDPVQAGDTLIPGFWHTHASLTSHWHNGSTDHSGDTIDHSGDTTDHSGDTTTLGFWHTHASLTSHWHNGSTDHSGDTIDHSDDFTNHSGDITLFVSVSASRSSGDAPLNNVSITASVSGNATESIVYKLDCTNDGSFEATTLQSETTFTFATTCSYSSAGLYTVKVQATRQTLIDSGTKTITVTSPPPDLIVQSITASPSSPTPGQTITYTVVVKNQGASNSSGGWLGGYTFNPSNSCADEESAFGPKTLGTIAAGSTKPFTITKINGFSTSGNHTVWMFADDLCGVSESSETNNKKSLPITVASLPQCSAPTGFTMQSRTTNSITMQWPAVSGANTYKMQWCSSGFCNTPGEAIGSIITLPGEISATATGLSSGTGYAMNVRVETDNNTTCNAPGSWFGATGVATSSCAKSVPPPVDPFTVGECTVSIEGRAWDITDDVIAGYETNASGTNFRELDLDDDPGGCDDNLRFKNTWSISGNNVTVETISARLGSTTNDFDAGFELSVSPVSPVSPGICSISHALISGSPATTGDWRMVRNEGTHSTTFGIVFVSEDIVAPTITVGELRRVFDPEVGSVDISFGTLGSQWLKTGLYVISVSVDPEGGSGIDTDYRPVIIRSIGPDDDWGTPDDKVFSTTRTVDDTFAVWIGDGVLDNCGDEGLREGLLGRCRIEVGAKDLAGNDVTLVKYLRIDFTAPSAQ